MTRHNQDGPQQAATVNTSHPVRDSALKHNTAGCVTANAHNPTKEKIKTRTKDLDDGGVKP